MVEQKDISVWQSLKDKLTQTSTTIHVNCNDIKGSKYHPISAE